MKGLGALVLVVLLAAVFGFVGAPASSSSSPRVLFRERARGVRRELQELLDAWELEGTHQVLIPSEPWGGLRTAEQQEALAAGGFSQASTLASSAHGRGGALDVWPVSFLAYVPRSAGGSASRWASWAEVPQRVRDEFHAFGLFAEARGFTWGGRWRSSTFPNGDQPHVELTAWRSLPFPPPEGGYA